MPTKVRLKLLTKKIRPLVIKEIIMFYISKSGFTVQTFIHKSVLTGTVKNFLFSVTLASDRF